VRGGEKGGGDRIDRGRKVGVGGCRGEKGGGGGQGNKGRGYGGPEAEGGWGWVEGCGLWRLCAER